MGATVGGGVDSEKKGLQASDCDSVSSSVEWGQDGCLLHLGVERTKGSSPSFPSPGLPCPLRPPISTPAAPCLLWGSPSYRPRKVHRSPVEPTPWIWDYCATLLPPGPSPTNSWVLTGSGLEAGRYSFSLSPTPLGLVPMHRRKAGGI